MFLKKYKQLIIGFVLGAVAFSASPIKAAIEEYICYKADYKVVINGTEYISGDLPILNYKGSTYAPFRSMLEKSGLDVAWNAELNQAEVTAKSVSAQTTINKEVTSMSTVLTGRSLVELLGKKYPSLIEKITLDKNGILTFDDKIFNLPVNSGNVDAQELVKSGILTLEDFQ